MSNTPAIQVENLRKTYTDGLFFRRHFEALKGISFEVKRGEIFGLLGPNGAGKTTFIKILLGIIKKSEGKATLLGHPAGSRQGRQVVGYLPENLRMPRHLNAYTALEYYGSLSNLPASLIKQKRDELLATVGLSDWATTSVKKYSKGMLQRLGLAQALLHDPKLLVLDEPTDGLDPKARAHVRQILTDLKERKGTTIFLNSHILQEVEVVCDRVAILDRGELKYVGSVRDIGKHLHQTPGLSQTDAQRDQAVQTETGSEQTELEVDLELEGDEALIRQVLEKHALQNLQHITPTELRAAVRLPDQKAVDQCVDELRAKGVNIVGLSRRRVTLEAAFLEIINEPSEP